MEISCILPVDLSPVFRVYADDIRKMTLGEALSYLCDEFPTLDSNHVFPFTMYDHRVGDKKMTMSIGARIRIFHGTLLSRPLMFKIPALNCLYEDQENSDSKESVGQAPAPVN